MASSAPVTKDQLACLRSTLLNASGSVPLAARFRALFTLRSLNSDEAVAVVGEAFPTATALLGHELAYVLGQMGRESALPVLERILRDPRQHPMVRHEAGEAMGAISSPSSLPVLREFLADPNVSVRETCELAIQKILHDQALPVPGPSKPTGGFGSVDPAPPMSMHGTVAGSDERADGEGVGAMRQALLDSNLPLFERYRAMFGLRNAAAQGRAEPVRVQAVEALAEGFGDGSALFRHEIAYIFGQLCHPASVPSLLAVLKNHNEDEMVRHEAAEALGSIATPDVLPALREFGSPEEKSRVVRESCQVALDMYEYENSGQLHYAMPLDALNGANGNAHVPTTVTA